MKEHLQALAAEVRRLRLHGVRHLSVQPATVERLRRALQTAPPSSAPGPLSAPIPVQPPAEVSAPVPPPAPSAPRRAAAAPPAAAPAPPPAEVELPPGSKAEQWAWLLRRVREDPVCVAQARPGKQVVLGVGNLDATLAFIGEAPGAEEETRGEPFVGPAGELLTRMIKAMGLERSDVYIGNIINWRPRLPTAEGEDQVGNRPPTAAEMAHCLPYLRAQLAIVRPSVLIALGKTALDGLLGPGRFKTLTEARGRWFDWEGRPLMVTYHPSYLLRNQALSEKRKAWEDLLKVMERAALPISDQQRRFFLPRT